MHNFQKEIVVLEKELNWGFRTVYNSPLPFARPEEKLNSNMDTHSSFFEGTHKNKQTTSNEKISNENYQEEWKRGWLKYVSQVAKQ